MGRLSVAFALSTLLFVLSSSAQQKLTTPGNPANTTKSDVGIDTVVNCTIAANNYIPVFTAVMPPNIMVCNSAIYQAGNDIGIGTTTPAVRLDVHGRINTSLAYQIGESDVLSIGSSADNNTFVGVGAGANNQAGSGVNNTFSGSQAGNSNTTGAGNTFTGVNAGYNNTTGSQNTYTGRSAGGNTGYSAQNTFTGYEAGRFSAGFDNGYNVFNGYQAGYNNTGGDVVAEGIQAGYNNMGNFNVFIGSGAGFNNTTGLWNTFIGDETYSPWANTTGYSNLYLMSGGRSESNKTGNNNVYLNADCACDESFAIRIGDAQYIGTWIAAIYGSTSSGGVPVLVNSNGRLGTTSSSLRFKEQVRDMGDSTSALMKLRPVTFLYKPEYADGERTLQYGLIAEEVAQVYPELVAYDKDGQPYSVRYQYITTMLLNEVQKQYRRAEAEAKVITRQEEKIEQLEQRLSRLEGLVRAQVQTVAEQRE